MNTQYSVYRTRRTRAHRRRLSPTCDTFESAERFAHRDLDRGDLDLARLWAEAALVQARLADLLYRKRHGALLTVVNEQPVYEDAWLKERLRRLRAVLRRRRAA